MNKEQINNFLFNDILPAFNFSKEQREKNVSSNEDEKGKENEEHN